MNGEGENQQAGIDDPRRLQEVIRDLQAALKAGKRERSDHLRAEAIEIAKAVKARLDALETATTEAGLLQKLLQDPVDVEALEAVVSFKPSPRKKPTPLSAADVRNPPPPALFRTHDNTGALWPMGEIALLAGEGGTGKSTLAGELALSVAAFPSGPIDVDCVDDSNRLPLLPCRGGPVLWLAYEEQDGLLAKRLRVRARDRGIPDAASRVYILNLRGDEDGGWPLFGPGDRNGSAGLYNSRPEPLCGWDVMVDGAKKVLDLSGERPTIVVLDPTLSAYVGETNGVPPVREFIGSLGAWAESEDLGVLLVAHATKEGNVGPFDRQQVGGSAAWTDAVRCCLTLTFGDGSEKRGVVDTRTFAVLKANTGPSRIWTPVSPVRREGNQSGWIVGYECRDRTGKWLDQSEWRAPRTSKLRKGRKLTGSGKSKKNDAAQTDPLPLENTSWNEPPPRRNRDERR